MKYKIVAAEKRETKDGKPYFTMTLGDEATAVDIDRVGVFDNLESIKVGSEIEGSIVENAAGYKNFRFPRQAGVKGQGGNKTQQMERVMERKEQSILGAMDRKERGILFAGASRDATLMVTTLMGAFPDDWHDFTADMIKNEWRMWRSFFINAFDEQPNEPFNSNGK